MRTFLILSLSATLLAGSGTAWAQSSPPSQIGTIGQSPSSHPSRAYRHKPDNSSGGQKQGNNPPPAKTPPSPSSLSVSRGEHEADRILTPPALKSDRNPQ